MNKSFVLIIAGFLGLFLLFSGCITQEETIKIGHIGSLSGNAAALGQESQKVYLLAVNEINSNGGINGKKLEVIYEDGKCSPSDSILAAQKLINQDNVKVILGGFCSSETLAVAPLVNQKKVILFSSASSSPEVTNAGDFVFRNYPSDTFQGIYMAKLAKDNNYGVVGIIVENKDYSIGIAKEFEETFSDLNGIYFEEKFNTDDKDLKAQISNILSKNPDVIYLIPQTGDQGIILFKQLKELGYSGKIFTNEQINTDVVLTNNKDLIDGAIFVDPTIGGDKNKINKFINDWNNRYEKEFEYLPLIYYLTAYDSVYIIKDAIEKCGDENTICIRDYLYSLNNWSGLSGNITMDNYGDVIWNNYNVKIIKDGKAEILN